MLWLIHIERFVMATDIVTQLKELAPSLERGEGRSTVYGAVSEIERLRMLVSHFETNFRSQEEVLQIQNRNVERLSQSLYEALNKNPQEVNGE